MEPFTLAIIIGAGLVATVTIAFWDKIVTAMLDTVLPWLEANIPELAPLARDIFQQADKVVSTVRRSAKQLYRNMRKYLLKATTTFTRDQGAATFTQRTESYVRDPQGAFYKQTSDVQLSWDDLPDDVRSATLHGAQTPAVNVLAPYDTEFEYTLTH